ncbi:hypothetical protein [Moorena producens]|uniref:hypothetical protein n=1 Tax=Moorena producens TaxID=1155739 RepID=UPI000AD586DE|nr:hypothetical protein [Moorena producens]
MQKNITIINPGWVHLSNHSAYALRITIRYTELFSFFPVLCSLLPAPCSLLPAP